MRNRSSGKQVSAWRRAVAQADRAEAYAKGKTEAKPYSPTGGEYRPKRVVDARPGKTEGISGNAGRPDAPKVRRSVDDLRAEAERLARGGRVGRPRYK